MYSTWLNSKGVRVPGILTDAKVLAMDEISKHYEGMESSKGVVHIKDGVKILEKLGASSDTIVAYILHPLFQSADELRKAVNSSDLLYSYSPRVIVLLMEYRNKANSYLCRTATDNYTISDLPYIVLEETRQMLIADKVQNFSNFSKHYRDHPRCSQLQKYFKQWLEHLEVTPAVFKGLTET